ncbi:hypothetical protein [Thauera linaloolentis]|uniref:Uncharacterized protein n=1 Tax=Thauera linaloolentis (strain DSM 12138 / JCM 21573 / CCUG 41526 / CIP 105981 / IAM 15112 / NBRC 102519 / 47Lol) TaxID=1123367 RepID=N6Y829_THAL4|nr:hypothetical protein [Thauera linaloolentis]ENO90396.1 hypothetical protein C666_01940 [Thauera linaloolentis 47Lol = DSM 12138]MCM8564029.1 hypothetical protein [Thauera linaloolentis]
MDLTVVLGLIIALLCFAAWTSLRRRTQPLPVRAGMPNHPYHCVTIEARDSGCDAVRRMAGERFLAARAPRLPLPGCRRGNCECIYLHYEDRRHHNRRDPYVHAQRMQFTDVPQDRRNTPGRRKTDLLVHPML